MSKNMGFKGQVRGYVQWPLLFSVLLVLFNVGIYFVDRRSGFVTTVFVIIYVTVALIFYFRSRTLVLNDFINFATRYGQVQRQLLRDLEVPYALLDDSGKIIWTNESFEETLGVRRDCRKP
ncbi:MAG TPA: DHH family phosphoesterase, partial [Lachnospiraceae bacterium]|nr:DHH family phosphoesterase [Lachnospiraceae bacterium]